VINGAAARHFHPNDKVIVVAFCLTDEAIAPRMIAVDESNRFAGFLVKAQSEEVLAR
jgi:aspartate 1-decarboxylase